MFIIKNNEGQYWSNMAESEYGDGWTLRNPTFYETYQEAATEAERIGGKFYWVYEVKLHSF